MKKSRYLARQMRRRRRLQKRIFTGAGVLSVLLLAFVFWQLRVPGETATRDTFALCGYSEHVHADACYNTDLACDIQAHVHDTTCYSAPLVCGREETGSPYPR